MLRQGSNLNFLVTVDDIYHCVYFKLGVKSFLDGYLLSEYKSVTVNFERGRLFALCLRLEGRKDNYIIKASYKTPNREDDMFIYKLALFFYRKWIC